MRKASLDLMNKIKSMSFNFDILFDQIRTANINITEEIEKELTLFSWWGSLVPIGNNHKNASKCDNHAAETKEINGFLVSNQTI